jgi:hypothetical protein
MNRTAFTYPAAALMLICFFVPKLRLIWRGKGNIQEYTTALYVLTAPCK